MSGKIKNRIKKIKLNFKARGIAFGLIFALLILAVLFISTMAWGIYKLEWRSPLIEKFLTIMPLPTAKVDGHYILYPDYLKTLQAAEKFYSKQGDAGMVQIPSQEELKKMTMDRLVEDIFIKELAAKYNIVVNQNEIDDKVKEVVANKGSEEEVEKFLQEYYGLTIAGYKEYFIKPNLYYKKTNEAVKDDETLNGAAKNKIQEVLNKLRNKENFEEVAKKYSEEEKAKDGEITENFLRGELPQDMEDQLFDMQEGEFTDILTFDNKLAIFKVVIKDLEKGVLTLNKIVVKIITIDDLLKEQKNKAQIKIYAY